jgi:ATP-dependent Lon protease
MEKVLLPRDNEPDWYELDKDIRDSLHAEFVETAPEVFKILFTESIYKGTSNKNTRTRKK